MRECQKERMSFKRNNDGVYGNKSYERERERALNWIRMEFMAINVTREKELVLKVIMMDFVALNVTERTRFSISFYLYNCA